MNYRTKLLPFLAPLLGLIALGAPTTATGETAVVHQEFLDANIPAMQALAEKGESSTLDARASLQALRDILVLRTKAYFELAEKERSSSFNGIVTMDLYDDETVLALYAVTKSYADRDTIPASRDHLERFGGIISGVPSLGEAPAAFMVIGLSTVILASADSLQRDPSLDPGMVAKAAVQVMHIGTSMFNQVYQTSQEDPMAARSSGQFYQNSVLMRLRCPKDEGGYVLNNMKNRVMDSGDIYTVNFIQCLICAEPRVIEFRQDLISRLHRMTEKQKLKKDFKPTRSGRGVDP